MNVDLVICNGTVIDGTGAPGPEGDVAVSEGKLVAVGNAKGSGAEEFDAKGRLVTPRFVDLRKHYDGQVVWDRYTDPSSWHSVTTTIMVVRDCGEHVASILEAGFPSVGALLQRP